MMTVEKFSFSFVPMPEDGFFWITFRGELGLGRPAKAHAEFTSHPDYTPGIDELLDFRETTIKDITRNDIDQIRLYVRDRTDRHHCKSVIVVNTELEYGLGRILGGRLSAEAPVDRGLAYSIEEALEWLRPSEGARLLAEFTDRSAG